MPTTLNNLYMDFDDVIGFFVDNGIYIVFILIVFKLVLPIWYKPRRKRFIVKSFFRIYPEVAHSTREQTNPKWPLFRTLHNFITIFLYSIIGLWLLLQLVMAISEFKPEFRLSK